MPLLTAAELLNSREAQEAGLTQVAEADAIQAIADATAELHALLGRKVEDTTTSLTVRGNGKLNLYLLQRVRTITSVTEDGVVLSSAAYEPSYFGWYLKRLDNRWGTADVVITGTFGFAAGDEVWTLARKAVRLMAVRYLSSTSSENNFPAGAGGALLTGFSSEGADFSFFTPDSDQTGHPDLDRLLELIRKAGGFPRRQGFGTVSLSNA